MVDDKDHILYLIKTEEHNRTFGGYFSVELLPHNNVDDDDDDDDYPHGEFIEDANSFIIQLDDQKLFKVRETSEANFYYSEQILRIGGGNDIMISDNCNQNTDNYTNFPYSYYGPDGTTDQTDET